MALKVAEPNYGMDRLSSEIFSILESKFLFGGSDQKENTDNHCSVVNSPRSLDSDAGVRRVRVLSVDAGGETEGLLAAASLAILESSLQNLTGDTSVRIADFFDVAAGSGVGGVLAALLFSPSSATSGGLPLSAAQALGLFVKHHRSITLLNKSKRGVFWKFFGGGKSKKPRSDYVFRDLFGDVTLKNTVKPVLIPCYDLTTGAPFLFSRADAVETDGYDFRMRDVCVATMGMEMAANVTSIDGTTRVSAATVDGGVITTGNPSSSAITHVLNNKTDFPFVRGLQDVFLVSIGNGEAGFSGDCPQPCYSTPSPTGIMKIVGDGVSDMIDQAVAMAFGPNRPANYVRVQGRRCSRRTVVDTKETTSTTATQLLRVAEEMLAQRSVESVLFRGKKLSEATNAEKLDWIAVELLKEDETRRKKSPLPPVVMFKAGGSPHGSFSGSSNSNSAASSSASSP